MTYIFDANLIQIHAVCADDRVACTVYKNLD